MLGYLSLCGVCFYSADGQFGHMPAKAVVFCPCVVAYTSNRTVTHHVRLVVYYRPQLLFSSRNGHSVTNRRGLLLSGRNRHSDP